MDNFEHALEKENADLRGQVEAICRALRQRDMPAADGAEALDTIRSLISAHGVELRGHLRAREEVERLTRERDEERARAGANSASFDRMLTDCDEWKARAEKAEAEKHVAEADNAEMVEVLNFVENDLSDDRHDDAHRRIITCLKKDHPGAALLGRLQAAETVVEAAQPFRMVVAMNFEVHRAPEHMPLPVTVTVKHGDALLAAFAAYDALTEGK